MGRFFWVRSCLLITLIKCLEGHKSLGSLGSVVKGLIVSWVGPTKGQGHLLSCSGQLKTKSACAYFQMFATKKSYWPNFLQQRHWQTCASVESLVLAGCCNLQRQHASHGPLVRWFPNSCHPDCTQCDYVHTQRQSVLNRI